MPEWTTTAGAEWATDEKDSWLPRPYTKQVSLDVFLTKQVSLDALLKGTLAKQVSLDSYLAYQCTKQNSLDAYLAYFKQTSLDADLKDTLTKQASLDSLLQAAPTKQTSLDAYLVYVVIKQTALDADLKGALSKQTALDVLLKGILARQVSHDTYLAYQYTKPVSLDAHLVSRLTKQVSLDARLVNRFTKQTSLDAHLVNRFTEQTSVDVLLKGTFTKPVSLDARLVNRLTEQIALDARLVNRLTEQVSLDAYLVNRFIRQSLVDALLKGTFTKQVAFDLYLTKETGYRVIIYDASGTALARVGDHQNLRVRQRVNKTWQLEFDIHRDSENYQHLAIDNLMQVQRNEVTIFAGMIKKRTPRFGEDGKATQYEHVFAPSFEIGLDGRRIERASGADYMEVTDNVDDAMKFMVRYNAVAGYVGDAKRVLTDLSVEADKAEHPSSRKLAGTYKDNLLERLMGWADAYSVDFWIDADVEAGTYVFRTKYPQRGTDRTVGNPAGNPHMVFSVNQGNILSLEYWEDSFDTCSLVYVGGPGEGRAQTIRKVYSGAEPEGWARRERFIGVADAQYEDELDAAGQAHLATWGDSIKGVRFKFQETGSCKYGADFNLGDLATVYDEDYGISLGRKIEEIEFALGKDGIEDIMLQVGSPEPTQWELFQARLGPYESFSDAVAPNEPTGLGYST